MCPRGPVLRASGRRKVNGPEVCLSSCQVQETLLSSRKPAPAPVLPKSVPRRYDVRRCSGPARARTSTFGETRPRAACRGHTLRAARRQLAGHRACELCCKTNSVVSLRAPRSAQYLRHQARASRAVFAACLRVPHTVAAAATARVALTVHVGPCLTSWRAVSLFDAAPLRVLSRAAVALPAARRVPPAPHAPPRMQH